MLCIDQVLQFYHDCEILVTINFIFGVLTILIYNFVIFVRNPNPWQENVVVEDGMYKNISANRIVFQNCSIMSDVELLPYVLTAKTSLARQWKAFSRSFFINDNFGNFIQW